MKPVLLHLAPDRVPRNASRGGSTARPLIMRAKLPRPHCGTLCVVCSSGRSGGFVLGQVELVVSDARDEGTHLRFGEGEGHRRGSEQVGAIPRSPGIAGSSSSGTST